MIRARCDISDFDPQGVPAITESAAGWVAMGKHLCGGATDLMLRCCVRNPKASTQGAPASTLRSTRIDQAWSCLQRVVLAAARQERLRLALPCLLTLACRQIHKAPVVMRR